MTPSLSPCVYPHVLFPPNKRFTYFTTFHLFAEFLLQGRQRASALPLATNPWWSWIGLSSFIKMAQGQSIRWGTDILFQATAGHSHPQSHLEIIPIVTDQGSWSSLINRNWQEARQETQARLYCYSRVWAKTSSDSLACSPTGGKLVAFMGSA